MIWSWTEIALYVLIEGGAILGLYLSMRATTENAQ
jgi:hypothetical protein